jgi:PRTRC genetic system protein B
MNAANTNKRLSPTMAIIVYQDRSEYQQQCFLEKREIKIVGDRFRFMAPVAMADDTLQEISKFYMKSRSSVMGFGGLISPHILFGVNKAGLTSVMWYRPAMKRALNFSSSLKIKGASNVDVPATLYLVVNNNLYVFALITDDRPTENTKIYKAPYFNIYEDGRVCLGTANVGRKQNVYEKEAERFERGFYMAEQNGGDSEHNCKTALPKLWSSLIKTKSAFPSKKELVLHPKYKNVLDLMQKLIGKNINDEED